MILNAEYKSYSQSLVPNWKENKMGEREQVIHTFIGARSTAMPS